MAIAETTDERPPATVAHHGSRLSGRDVLSRTSLLGIWFLLALFYAIIQPDLFLQSGTARTIFGSQFELVLLGLALICTFVVGEFDLSVAAILGFAGTLVSLLVVQEGWSPALASVAAIGASGAIGVINGVLIVRVGVNPIVATLGMATLIVGLTLWASDLTTIQGLPPEFSNVANAEVLGLPIAAFYALALTLVLAYILGMTPLGRRMAFVGSGPEIARLAGVNVDRIRFGSYIFSALICGFAGVLLGASLGGFDPNSSGQYLLPAFAAVFLGTAVVQPGKFNPIGTLIAVYFLQTGIVGLQLTGATGWIDNVFFGGSLVIAIAATTLIRKRTTG